MSLSQDGFEAVEALLAKFEADMERPESAEVLSTALRELANLRDAAPSMEFRQRYVNRASSYARLIATHVEGLIGLNSHLHSAVVDQWVNLFSKFDDNGFDLPEDAAACRSRVVFRGVLQQVQFLSEADKELLRQKLRAHSEDGGGDLPSY